MPTFTALTTLDGKSNELKGYTIGVDALGKSSDFDPTDDNTERIDDREPGSLDVINSLLAARGIPLIAKFSDTDNTDPLESTRENDVGNEWFDCRVFVKLWLDVPPAL